MLVVRVAVLNTEEKNNRKKYETSECRTSAQRTPCSVEGTLAVRPTTLGRLTATHWIPNIRDNVQGENRNCSQISTVLLIHNSAHKHNRIMLINFENSHVNYVSKDGWPSPSSLGWCRLRFVFFFQILLCLCFNVPCTRVLIFIGSGEPLIVSQFCRTAW